MGVSHIPINNMYKSRNRLCMEFISFTLLFFLVSCNPIKMTTDSESEIIHNYQKELSFTVVLPKYLPKNCTYFGAGVQGPPIGFTKEWFEVSYYDPLKGNIHINETDEYHELVPTSDNYSYIYFSSVRVLEEELVFDSNHVHTFWYEWNQNGIYFLVMIEGQSQDERHKLVDSLITH